MILSNGSIVKGIFNNVEVVTIFVVHGGKVDCGKSVGMESQSLRQTGKYGRQ